VARRKYGRSDALSAAGHGTRPDEPAPSGQRPLSDAEPSSPQPPKTDEADAKPAQHFSSGLGEQLRQQQHYAAQQQAYQHNPIFAYLASIPGLSARQVHYLTAYFTSYPDKLNAEHWGTIADAHRRALAHGIAPESDQYFHFVNAQLHAPPTASAPPPMPEPAHATHIDLEKVESPKGEPEETHMSAMFSAPVSRGDHGHSVGDLTRPSSFVGGRVKRGLRMPKLAHLHALRAVSQAVRGSAPRCRCKGGVGFHFVRSACGPAKRTADKKRRGQRW
jgi:hypothetical protein